MTKIEFWLDPICPWCWLTSRWLVDLAPERDLDITWRPISLLIKNEVQTDSPYFEAANHTLGLLRVMESVRDAEGNDAVGRLYTVVGNEIHERQNKLVSAESALATAGLGASHAHAMNDDRYTTVIEASMADGLGLVGNDVGTPIIAFPDTNGNRTGFFGPVLSRIPTVSEGVKMWDAMVVLATNPAFWELKRTRTEGPNFDRPTTS